MAHSDVFIFLNTVTWVFFAFLLVYYSFVLFFLPAFYKRLRIRFLVGEMRVRILLVIAFDNFVLLCVFLEHIRGLFVRFVFLFRRFTKGSCVTSVSDSFFREFSVRAVLNRSFES